MMTNKKEVSFLFFVLCFVLSACGKNGNHVIAIGGDGGMETLSETKNMVAGTDVAINGTAVRDNEAYDGITGVSDTTQTAGVYVYVCGSVNHPGVFVLAEGSRVSEALEAAGGYAENADREYVNLAAKVTDGQKLYFPSYVEELPATEAEADDGRVNINTASAEELCRLPGIGETRAADIISYRESMGGFTVCEDIMKVSGIKTSVYNKIKDKIKVK